MMLLTEFTRTACNCRVRQFPARYSEAADSECSPWLDGTSRQASCISQHIADETRHARTALVSATNGFC